MDMRLTLIRDKPKIDHTPGEIFYEGKHIFYTCEDLVREKKIPGKTAIPFGVYKLVLTKSNRFKKILPLLLNVPNFEGVRIHGGNIAETETLVLTLPLENSAFLPDNFEVVA